MAEQDFQNYYSGLPGNPKLLARSSRNVWTRPSIPDPYGTESRESASKLHFVVTNHPLKSKLEDGLRGSIRKVLRSMNPVTWIAVDYVRLGYEEEAVNNPVVILVTAEKDETTPLEAQKTVDLVYLECVK